MTDEKKSRINYFFVRIFNQILSWEEQGFKEMGNTDITLRELHIIEAVYSLMDDGENRMTEIAKHLSITPGSLTTAVNCLVKKGYLKRESSEVDRRVVKLVPTQEAEEVNNMHKKLHNDMIDSVLNCIEEKDIETIIKLLNRLEGFFSTKKTSRN